MNRTRSAVLSILAVFLALFLASSALSLPMVAFRPVISDHGRIAPQAVPVLEPKIGTQSISPADIKPVLPVTMPAPQVDLGPRIPVTPRIPVPVPADDSDDDETTLPVIDLSPRIPVTPRIPVLVPADDSDETPSLPVIDFGPRVHVTPRIPIIKIAELSVEKFTANKLRVAYGDTVEFDFVIVNSGTKAAKFNYAFFPNYSDKSKPFVTETVALAPGEKFEGSVKYQYELPLVVPGSVRPKVAHPTIIVDYDNKVDELDETNNKAAITLALYEKEEVRKPDFNAAVSADASAFVEAPVDFTVTIANIGNKQVSGVAYEIDFGDGSAKETGSVGFMLPATSGTDVLSHKYSAAGRYVVSVRADPLNAQNELDETNNRGIFVINIVEQHIVDQQVFACSDGIDNDADGLVDMVDPGCESETDDDEFNEIVIGTQCSDSVDNDGDGLTDLEDPGCVDASDDDEYNEIVIETQCSDGVDNDADGLVDSEDPGCVDASDDDEFNDIIVLPQCSDGIDNDNDGLVDAVDPGCESDMDDNEFNAPDDGDENETDGNETDGNETGPVENIAPVAVISVTPLNGTAPLDVTLDGSGSHDSDGSIVSYSWVITGPAGYTYAELDVPGTPGRVNLTFSAAGNYAVMLIVIDDDGAAVSADASVHVVTGGGSNETGNQTDGNQAPVAVITATPNTGVAPLNITLDGSGSHDDSAIASHSWIITGPAGFLHQLTDVSGAPASINLIFNASGSYSVMLVVIDNAGVAGSSEISVAVSAAGSNTTTNTTTNSTSPSGPSISQRSVKEVTSSSAKVTWKTDVNADSKVLYGTEDDDLDENERSSSETKSHSIELTGLDASTKYYYKIVSCADSACSESGPYHFTTLSAGSSVSGSDDGSSSGGSSYNDLLSENMGLAGSSRSASGNSGDAAVVVTSQGATESGSGVEVVFAKPQFMEVEEEVCKFKFLWWCIWKDMITRKIPIPALASGVQFFV